MESMQGEYNYTKEFARRTTWRFFWRYSRRAVVIITLLVLVGGLRVLGGWNDLFTLLCLMFPFMYLAIWYSHRRRAERVATGLRDPRIIIVVDDAGLTLRSVDHTSTMTWAGVQEVWQFPEVWLLFPYGVGSAFTAVPTEALSNEALQLIGSKLRETGARIVT